MLHSFYGQSISNFTQFQIADCINKKAKNGISLVPKVINNDNIYFTKFKKITSQIRHTDHPPASSTHLSPAKQLHHRDPPLTRSTTPRPVILLTAGPLQSDAHSRRALPHAARPIISGVLNAWSIPLISAYDDDEDEEPCLPTIHTY